MLSIVIPTLNEAAVIGERLDQIATSDLVAEIIVVDGGSIDGTVACAERPGVRTIIGPVGRGVQLAAGAKVATGSWLLFIHADTKLGPGWANVIKRFTKKSENRFRAGYFRFVVDDSVSAARFLEKMVEWRCRVFNLPYGDQGLLISAEFYERLGGFPSIPLMEDVALIRAIPRHRLEELSCIAITSAKRYQRDGYVVRCGKNVFFLFLYLIGLPAGFIAKLYN